MDCYVRIYVPCEKDHQLIQGLGHYDMHFHGLSFDGYTDPVFSYGGDNGKQGYLSVFDRDETAQRFSNKTFLLMTDMFTATTAEVKACVDRIMSYTGSRQTFTVGYRYPVTSGVFKTYTEVKYNCFAATATWADWLGYGKLLSIYESASSNTDDSAYNMYMQYKSYWTNRGYYNC